MLSSTKLRFGTTSAERTYCTPFSITYDGPLEAFEDKYIRLGVNRAGNLLELMYNEVDGHTDIIFHAMGCRSIYYHLLRL